MSDNSFDGREGEEDVEKACRPEEDQERSLSRDFPPPPENHNDYYVEFDPKGDTFDPHNWSRIKKLGISAIGCYSCLCSTFASAVWSPATGVVGKAFGVSAEVATLTTSLMVLGYGFGPIIWGPASELYGRRYPMVISLFGFACFAAGAAVGKDLQTVLICRFFTGVMGSCPLSVVAGIFTDIYDHSHRGIAIAIFAGCIFVG